MNSIKRIPSLDGWRAISILLVLIGHEISDGSAFWIPNGGKKLNFLVWHFYGVQFFFVISGFIITHLLLDEEKRTGKIDLRGFYFRRVLRILPAFLAFLIGLFILSLFFTGEKIGTLYWLKAVFFLGDFGDNNWNLGHLWSLAVEEQFYLFWPLLVLHKKTRTIISLLVITIVPICRIIDHSHPNSIGEFSFFTRGDSIFIGALFAIYRNHPLFVKLQKYSGVLLVITALCLFAGKKGLAHTGAITVPFSYTLFSLSVVILIYRSFSENTVLYKILNTKALIWIGGISYSLYLWQQIFYPPSILGKTPVVLFPLNYIAIFTLAWASSRLIEKPVLEWRIRNSGKLKPVSA